MHGLHSLHDGLLVLPVHLLGLADRELLADRVEYLEAEEESVQVVAVEGALLIEVHLPGLLHILTRPELEELELEALDASRLAIRALSRAEGGRQAHSIVQLGDQRDQLGDRRGISDVLGPRLAGSLLFPLTIMLGAGRHVRLPDLDQAILALVEGDWVLEEGGHWVLLPLRVTTEVPFLLRDLLSEPDCLRDAVLPIVSLKHDSSDLLLLRLLLFFLHGLVEGALLLIRRCRSLFVGFGLILGVRRLLSVIGGQGVCVELRVATGIVVLILLLCGVHFLLLVGTGRFLLFHRSTLCHH